MRFNKKKMPINRIVPLGGTSDFDFNGTLMKVEGANGDGRAPDRQRERERDATLSRAVR